MSRKARKRVNAAMRKRKELRRVDPTLTEQERMARLQRLLFGTAPAWGFAAAKKGTR